MCQQDFVLLRSKPCKLDMYKPSTNSRQASLFWDLETMLDFKHPLFKLANMVDWSLFEKSFTPLFCADNGRPPKPIRLMTGLLMLKHLRNVSDEQVVVQFTENAYYQYFCGFQHIRTLRLVRTCPFSSPYRREGCGTYPQGEHPHQSCLGGQEEGRGG